MLKIEIKSKNSKKFQKNYNNIDDEENNNLISRHLVPVVLKLDFKFILENFAMALPIMLTLLIVDMFDNIDTLIGVTKRAGLLRPDGSLPKAGRALVADSFAAILSSLFGTSTVVSYIESASGVEAGGRGIARGEHAARFAGGRLGVLQGCMTNILMDGEGQIEGTHSVSAGLDYAAVGPEHAYYRDKGRLEFAYATDDECLEGFQLLSRTEGIIPALESSHAVAHGVKLAAKLPKEQVVIINLSGRGDKDVWSAARAMGTEIKL